MDLMARVKNMLVFEEGSKRKVYRCSKGFLTVGIGHNLDANPALDIIGKPLKLGDVIGSDIVLKLFFKDVANTMNDVRKIPGYEQLLDKYKLIVIGMVFQMGLESTLKFKRTLNAMRNDDLPKVLHGMRLSAWYKQTPNRVNRLMLVAQGECKDY